MAKSCDDPRLPLPLPVGVAPAPIFARLCRSSRRP